MKSKSEIYRVQNHRAYCIETGVEKDCDHGTCSLLSLTTTSPLSLPALTIYGARQPNHNTHGTVPVRPGFSPNLTEIHLPFSGPPRFAIHWSGLIP